MNSTSPSFVAKLRMMNQSSSQRVQFVRRISPDYSKSLRIWWQSLAPTVRDRPWPIELIVHAAFGKGGQRPALRLIARELRAMGFKERRDWTKAGRNRRYWDPPTRNEET